MLNPLARLKRALLAPDEPAAERPQEIVVVERKNSGASETPFDGVDLLAALFGAGAMYEAGAWLFMVLAFVQYFARRAPSTAAWLAEAVFGVNYADNPEAHRFFPGIQQSQLALPAPEGGH